MTCASSGKIISQDHVGWNSFSISTKVSDKVTTTLKPIFRNNYNLPTFLNWSPDYLVSYKHSSNWSFMALGRTWFIPNGSNRQFLFLDARYSTNAGQWGISNTVRWHLAFDVQQEDGDFLRWHPNIRWKKHKSFQPFIGLHVFYRLNGFNEFQRVRYILGSHVPLNNRMSLNIQYWNEVFYNLNPRRVNIWVVNLGYSI